MARYLIKFSKGRGIKFISHLDLMRSIQRAIRRSKIPVSYSKGFNPHSQFSFATPLPVGTWSLGEYMEIKLDEKIEAKEIITTVNKLLPEDIRFTYVREIDEKFPALMSIVDAASYEITLVNLPVDLIEEKKIYSFRNKDSIKVLKVSKKGEREIDIKPMIYDLKINNDSAGELILHTVLATGSRGNLSPELLVKAIEQYIDGFEEAEVRDIKKVETYVKRNGGFKTLTELSESDYV